MVAILSQQREVIFEAVRAMYADVAAHPEKSFHFPTGREACAFVGYPDELVDSVPATASESFAGVGFPFAAAAIRPGDTVLDIGSGSGTDALIASTITGPGGRVIGLDMTPAMLAKLTANAALLGTGNVTALRGNAEEIPLPDSSVDAVTSNGVLNLVPDKRTAVREIFRVLRPGGRVQIADIVLGRPAAEACRSNPRLWAECVVGATPRSDYLRLFHEAGMADVEVLSEHDYFAGSSSVETREVAELFGAVALVMRARKPGPGEVAAAAAWAEVEESDVRVDTRAEAVEAVRIVDTGARGCGEVSPFVRKELKAMAPGEILGVRSEMPEVGTELSAWCRLAGHRFLGSEPADGGSQIHFIRTRERQEERHG